MGWLVLLSNFCSFFFFRGPKRVVHRKSLEKPRTRKEKNNIGKLFLGLDAAAKY